MLLAPYDDLGAFSGRIRVAVEQMGVGESAATSLALVIRELATDSLKYGALSAEAGTLDVSSTGDGEGLTKIWMEQGGPAVASATHPRGFGSRLVDRTVTKQLAGSIVYEWTHGGLKATIRAQRELLAH